MIKDNQIDVYGDRSKDYIDSVRQACGFTHKIEMECRDMDGVKKAYRYDVDIIMVDNFFPKVGVVASKWLEETHRNILVNISGGITERQYY